MANTPAQATRLLNEGAAAESPALSGPRGNLPTNLLRSLVAIADAGSMSKAAEEIHLSQPTLSLQIKRLEEVAGASLFQRHQRGLLLTPEGRTLVAYAREILALNDRAMAAIADERQGGQVRVGMTQDFADAVLSTVLVKFARFHPETRLSVSINSSKELRNLLSAGLLDAIVCLGAADDPGVVVCRPMVWLGDPSLLTQSVLPIVLMDKPCIFRTAALEALEAVGQRFDIALETASLSVLRAAVTSGLGVTCRTADFVGLDVDVLDVPKASLPSVGYALISAPRIQPSTERLCRFLRQAIQEL